MFPAIAFIQNATKQGANFTETALTGYRTTSRKYSISATFCQPDQDTAKDPTVQVLTHGIGFDKSYWDLPYNAYNYSYVDSAVDKSGFCTLAIDRLGIGHSSHGDPKDEIQAPLEVEAIAAITRMLRNGTLPTVMHAFSTVVHVGHSYGSGLSYSLGNMYPDISDSLVLTGFTTNSSFLPYFSVAADFQQANLNQPFRFGSSASAKAVSAFVRNYALTDLISPLDITATAPYDYPNGYLTNSNVNSNQILFFYPPYFDTQILYYGETNKQPVAVGEMLTLNSLPKMNKFSGPVLVIAGCK